MRHVGKTLAALLWMGVAGCTPVPAHQSPAIEGLQPLRTSEIAELLVGRTLRHDAERGLRERLPGYQTFYRETFLADGTIAIFHNRSRWRGQYTIAGDRLCIEVSGRDRECRKFYRMRDGSLFHRDARRPQDRLTPIIVD